MTRAASSAAADARGRWAALGLFWVVAACSDPGVTVTAESATPAPPGGAAPAPKPELVKVPAGATDGAAVVRDEVARAERDGRKLIVYVGAAWCEPCVAFHQALERGDLDTELAGVRFLDFDLDQHGSLVESARCQSKLVPLFAAPTAEGTCSAKRTEGGIKGDGAVRHIVPRLKRIL